MNKSDEAETIEKDVTEPETDEAENRKRTADAIDDKTEPSRPKRKSLENEEDAMTKENRKRTAEDDENQNVKRQKKNKMISPNQTSIPQTIN